METQSNLLDYVQRCIRAVLFENQNVITARTGGCGQAILKNAGHRPSRPFRLTKSTQQFVVREQNVRWHLLFTKKQVLLARRDKGWRLFSIEHSLVCALYIPAYPVEGRPWPPTLQLVCGPDVRQLSIVIQE
jgi:hypothetical protein